MKAYRLQTNTSLPKVETCDWLMDLDEDYTSKKAYIADAKKFTVKANKELGTNYSYKELFGEPEFLGWVYCSYCNEFHWSGEC